MALRGEDDKNMEAFMSGWCPQRGGTCPILLIGSWHQVATFARHAIAILIAHVIFNLIICWQIIKGQIWNCLKMLLINTKISLPQIKEKYYEKEIQFEEGGGA